ncbi:DUF2568 domain-containing protein [Mesobacillus persicus]
MFGEGGLLKWVLGLGAPTLLAVFWGIFGSPKAIINLSTPLHFVR